jgi:hypothetical protein
LKKCSFLTGDCTGFEDVVWWWSFSFRVKSTCFAEEVGVKSNRIESFELLFRVGDKLFMEEVDVQSTLIFLEIGDGDRMGLHFLLVGA